ATLRIAYGSLNGPGMYFVEALDANGMTLIGEPEWFIDDVPVEPEYGVIMPDEVAGSTIRVRMGGAEATLEVL
ncbi:MAG: hypothetical protein AB8H86_34280, partial [Polyangiales bacterium]